MRQSTTRQTVTSVSALGGSLRTVAGRCATLLVGGLLEHGLERELAAVVDLGDLHQDLLADAEHVFDVLDALATGELADLADVQQSVLAGQERDERAEGGDLDDGSEELLADLGVESGWRSR